MQSGSSKGRKSKQSDKPSRRCPSAHNTKHIGELAEMEFMLRAHARGFPVGKPFGAEHYDVMVDSSGRIWRVQVRCTNSRHYRGFTVRSFWKRGPKEYFAYTPAEIDFLAVYILTHEIWYIIPVRALKGRVGFDVYPFGTRGAAEFEKYKEAWDLLKKNLQPPSRALSS